MRLTEKGLNIGRHTDNDLALASEQISRYHLRVTWDGQQVNVIDLGSSNGSFSSRNTCAS